jgi:hypothetical protein
MPYSLTDSAARQHLQLHVLGLDVVTRDAAFCEWIDRLYVSNDLRGALPTRASSLTLRIERADDRDAPIPEAPPGAAFAEMTMCTAPCYYARGRFFSASDSPYWHRMDYDLDSRTIRASIGGIYLTRPQAVVSNLLRPILQSFLLPFHGLKTLHGAIVSKGGHTIFLMGSGGSGKSTTTAQLMRDGYDLISDDGPFFTIDGTAAIAMSSLDFLHVTKNTLDMFPELEPHVVGVMDHRDKFAVHRAGLQRGDAWQRPLLVDTIVRLRRGPVNRPVVRTYDKRALMRDLFNETMIVFRPSVFRDRAPLFKAYSDFIFEVVAGVVRDAHAVELEFADHHLRDLPAIIDRLGPNGVSF